jgi:hypothetical protein
MRTVVVQYYIKFGAFCTQFALKIKNLKKFKFLFSKKNQIKYEKPITKNFVSQIKQKTGEHFL